MEIGGAYNADRAAALSGVPRSTIYHWARRGHLIPSVSQSPLLWSYTDLLALRTVYWLRQPKKAFDREVPATSMAKVRRALKEIKRLNLDLFEEGRPVVAVTLKGEITVDVDAVPLQVVEGQYLERDLVDLIGPFEGLEGTKGPDLAWPRPTLQILPRKISGAPHIAGTRLPTESIFALADRGFTVEQLAKIYPFVDRKSLGDSIDLEKQLQQNASLRQAA
jgi:uncharacterized protein (DUF433 family)